MINYKKRDNTNVWLGSKSKQQGGLGVRTANVLLSRKPKTQLITMTVTAQQQAVIDKKRAIGWQSKQNGMKRSLENLGHSLESDSLRAKNPYSRLFWNTTVQGYLFLFDNVLSNELKIAANANNRG
jgi:hypothetical protein